MQDQAPALLWREEGGRGGRNKVPPPPFPPPYVALVKAEGSPAPREGGRMGGGEGGRVCPRAPGRVPVCKDVCGTRPEECLHGGEGTR